MAKAQAGCGKSISLQEAIVNILLLLLIVIDGVAAVDTLNGLKTRTRRLVKSFKKPSATIKTIQSEDGDIIDCVDIYKQPAFDHPALKNHTIQMRPSDYSEERTKAWNATSSLGSPAQLRRMNEDCPEGTIPILRSRKTDLLKEIYPTNTLVTEGVRFIVTGKTYFGIEAYLNVWDGLHVEPKEDTSALILLSRLTPSGANYVSAGWTISKSLYGDADATARLTIYWTADGSRDTGCFNINCAGFVQVDKQIYLGAIFNRTSVYHGDQYEIFVSIYLDEKSNNWWLNFFNTPVGYWPGSIFKDLSSGDSVTWAGEVGLLSAEYCGGSGFQHSTTQMGSGHNPSPSEGFKGSAYISCALSRGHHRRKHAPFKGFFQVDKPYCYGLMDNGMDHFGCHGKSFYYGGDAKQEACF